MFNVIKLFGLVVDDVGGWIDMIVIVDSVRYEIESLPFSEGF